MGDNCVYVRAAQSAPDLRFKLEHKSRFANWNLPTSRFDDAVYE